MKTIAHVIIACSYMNGYGYQENILPKKHKELGFKVDIITYNKKGRTMTPDLRPPTTYINPDGIPVHLLATNQSIWKKIPWISAIVKETKGLYKELRSLKPDIIFVHGIGILDNMEVIKYKKQHMEVKLYADNHSDYYNTPVRNKKQKLLRRFFKLTIGKSFSKYAEKVWGVTPWRVRYQEEVYGIPPSKSGLLVMGGDESFINWSNRSQVRAIIRKSVGIPEDSFVVITGGKIDKAKNIHHLIEAVVGLNNPKVHILVFGKIEPDMEDKQYLFNLPNVHYVGWLNANDCYDYYLASDLAAFPGTHSVLWEQACASGLPGIFKDWDNGGFNHVDVGGNCILCKDCSTQGLSVVLRQVIGTEKFESMKYVAENKGREFFSYREIAKRAIEME